MTVDRKCYDLACHFLQEEPLLDNPKNAEELAGAIHDTIKSWFFEKTICYPDPPDWLKPVP